MPLDAFGYAITSCFEAEACAVWSRFRTSSYPSSVLYVISLEVNIAYHRVIFLSYHFFSWWPNCFLPDSLGEVMHDSLSPLLTLLIPFHFLDFQNLSNLLTYLQDFPSKTQLAQASLTARSYVLTNVSRKNLVSILSWQPVCPCLHYCPDRF